MGSRIGRQFRRTMDGRSAQGSIDNNNGSSSRSGRSNEEDESAYAAVLAYLIRSGQIRLLPGDRSDDEEMEEDSSVILSPTQDVQVNSLQKTEFYQEMIFKTGEKHRSLHPSTAPHIAFQREIGRGYSRNCHRSLYTSFFPNYMDKDKKIPIMQKCFCGTFSADGNTFLSACQDQHIRLFDARRESLECVKTIRARDMGWSVLDTALSSDGHNFVYSSWSECVHICNVSAESEVHNALYLHPRTNHNFCIFSLTFSMDNREILGGANDRHLYVFDRSINSRTLAIPAHEDDVNAVAYADNSSQILFSGGDDGLVKVWDRRTLSEELPVPVGILAGHMDGITFIDSKGDARYLISNSKDQSIKLWDIRKFSSKEAQQATLSEVAQQNWDYRWQPVPRRVKTRSKTIPGDTSLMTYKGHSILHTLIRCRFSPQFTTGQRYIYTGCASGKLIIYDSLTGEIVRNLKGHGSCVRDVSWHPYEQRIVTSSWDGYMGVWEHLNPDAREDCSDSEEEPEDDSKLRRSERIKAQIRRRFGRNVVDLSR